jgi:hypothetical protein
MDGSLAYAFGLFSSAIGAAVAGVPWVAVAGVLAAIPYFAIGLLRLLEAVRPRPRRTRLLLH